MISFSSPKRQIEKSHQRQALKAELVTSPDIHKLEHWVQDVKSGAALFVKPGKSGPAVSSSLTGVGVTAGERQAFKKIVRDVVEPYVRQGQALGIDATREDREVRKAADHLQKICDTALWSKGLKNSKSFYRAVSALAAAVRARDEALAAKGEQQLLDEAAAWEGSGAVTLESEDDRSSVPLDEQRQPDRYEQLMEQANQIRKGKGKRPDPEAAGREADMRNLATAFKKRRLPDTKETFLAFCFRLRRFESLPQYEVLLILRRSLFDTSLLAHLPEDSVMDLIRTVAHLEEAPWRWLPDLAQERDALLARMNGEIPVQPPVDGPDAATLSALAHAFKVKESEVEVLAVSVHFPPEQVERLALGVWHGYRLQTDLLACLVAEDGTPMPLSTVRALLSTTSLLTQLPKPAAQALIDAYCRASLET